MLLHFSTTTSNNTKKKTLQLVTCQEFLCSVFRPGHKPRVDGTSEIPAYLNIFTPLSLSLSMYRTSQVKLSIPVSTKTVILCHY